MRQSRIESGHKTDAELWNVLTQRHDAYIVSLSSLGTYALAPSYESQLLFNAAVEAATKERRLAYISYKRVIAEMFERIHRQPVNLRTQK
jgi:hypothetical protein